MPFFLPFFLSFQVAALFVRLPRTPRLIEKEVEKLELAASCVSRARRILNIFGCIF